MRTLSTPRKLAIGAATVALVLGGVACSDEDGDGATTDEEVDQVDETVDSLVDEGQDTVDSLVDEGEQEVDQGEAEVDQNDAGG